MREIKFRVWDTNNCSFLRPYDCRINGLGDLGYSSNAIITPPIKGLIIQQFTGLKDKNGVDIYEGDIVIYDRGIGNWTGERMSTTHEIVFSNEVFVWCASLVS